MILFGLVAGILLFWTVVCFLIGVKIEYWSYGFGSIVAFAGLYYAAEKARHSHEEIKRNQKEAEPILKFGAKKHSTGAPTHLMEFKISDSKKLLMNPKVEDMSGNLDGLNIGKKGQKCKPHQFRIAARVPEGKPAQFRIIYEDEFGKKYQKLVTWLPETESLYQVE